MNKGWDVDEDRLLRYMRIPVSKRMEWLAQMHAAMRRTYTKEQKRIFWKLRGIK